MKVKKIFQTVILFISLLTLFGCKNQSNSTKQNNHKQVEKKTLIKVYPVKVQSIKAIKKGRFILSGKTTAPNGARIVGQAVNKNVSNTDNDAYKVGDEDEFAYVKHNSFTTQIDAYDLSDEDIYKVGQKLAIKLFATTKQKPDDIEINKTVREKINHKEFKNTTVTINKESAQYFENKNSVENYEDSLDDKLDDYDTEDDPTVTWKGNTLLVSLKVRAASLYTGDGEEGYLVPILSTAKKISSKSTLKNISIKIYDNLSKKRKPEIFDIGKVKQINWKKVENMDNDDLNDFFLKTFPNA